LKDANTTPHKTESEQLQEELLAEITEHDVAAPVIANRKDQEVEG
jgi:hypothetical protein